MAQLEHARSTVNVLSSPPFSIPAYNLTNPERALLAYKRAELASSVYGLTLNDLVKVTPKFWKLHQDPFSVWDMGALTLITIQYNLCAGTLAGFAEQRPDLVPIVQDLLKWRKHGQFLLTEVGHGIDMGNIETTATRLPSGEFILNSPTPQAYKHMPPTIPAGKPTLAVVFARLIVNREDRGIRPFIVALNDGKQMCSGITARLLPERGGAHPVNHALTSFNNVRLPASALLGSLEYPKSLREHMAAITWRVAIGSIALACESIPAMELSVAISTKYSIRRQVGPEGSRRSILDFRTQQIPILTSTAQVYVFKAFAEWGTSIMQDGELDFRVRHAVATIVKAVTMKHSLAATRTISERCGAQGVFEHNQISAISGGLIGISIAEGDVLSLSIRLATELLQGRYEVPEPRNPSGVLAQYETALMEECRAFVMSLPNIRSDQVNKFILPQCLPLVEAIGYRMAYECAVEAKLPSYVIDLFVASVIKLNPAWFIEEMKMTRRHIAEIESKALDEMLPHQEELIQALNVDQYISAPMASDEKWEAFVKRLPVFDGTGKVALFGGEYGEQDQYRASARL
ncbi:acyl-CoA dehydrogenase NM domain-like protein [Abortiporus biennis]|nr:acyl-CoA dehydrogenase NM domain-like protein [Abortiporus biennis]